MIRIGNIKTFEDDGSVRFLVDRRSPLGNPFVMRNEDQRDKVCNSYEGWFDKRLNDNKRDGFKGELARLHSISKTQDITLLCWCHPKRCHAETIKRYLDERLNQSVLERSDNL